ncbi:MAG: adenylyltransferase/cytidyltransferase family protein [Anaerolineaceae bacterium]|nr:adenylyltransferase/cytidyltransferase family protein [Anaerolineaceae bacterium]
MKRNNQPHHYTRIGMIARWQPVHLGHEPVLHALCEQAQHALIGIGSSNKYDYRNPFSLEERTHMLRLLLGDRENYTLIPVPDLGNGPRWREMVLKLFGSLDLFISANPYVTSLLEDDYNIIRPVELVPDEKRVAVDGAMVRREMAHGDGWMDLVPSEIEAYIRERCLDAKFRQDFGLLTLALDAIIRR